LLLSIKKCLAIAALLLAYATAAHAHVNLYNPDPWGYPSNNSQPQIRPYNGGYAIQGPNGMPGITIPRPRMENAPDSQLPPPPAMSSYNPQEQTSTGPMFGLVSMEPHHLAFTLDSSHGRPKENDCGG
jgi:hypothetical protein